MESDCMIGILDFGSAGNVRSVANALIRNGAQFKVVKKAESRLDGLIVPGVGSFSVAGKIRQALGKPGELEYPMLGICLGMQALFESSEEDGKTAGLGVVAGRVRRLRGNVALPQLGWNSVRQEGKDALFAGITDGAYFYFANSYAGFPENEECVIASANYGERFACAVRNNNTWGVQFHPEKSGKAGARLLANFEMICTR